MVKKIILGVALFGLIGILVGGAVLRTLDKTAPSSAAHNSQGRERTSQDYVVSQNGGQRNGQSQEHANGSGETAGEGEARVDMWVPREGAVTSVSEDMATVMLADGEELIIEGRAWSFAQEQGWTVGVGDQLKLSGFFEGETFETGQIDNLSTGQSVTLREESGRPLWAGRGRRAA